MQINPDNDGQWYHWVGGWQRFNRINSCRSIPTMSIATTVLDAAENVSIVSIHADQSRPGHALAAERLIGITRFNRINSCRSIPTPIASVYIFQENRVSIVSIHADQSRQE